MLDSCIILSKFSRVLCPGLGSPSYQTVSVAGLNFMKPGSFGFWNEVSESGFRGLGLGFSNSIRHLLELACGKILPSQGPSEPSNRPLWFLPTSTTPVLLH